MKIEVEVVELERGRWRVRGERVDEVVAAADADEAVEVTERRLDFYVLVDDVLQVLGVEDFAPEDVAWALAYLDAEA